jgi:hypothetical protein
MIIINYEFFLKDFIAFGGLLDCLISEYSRDFKGKN